jgi:hypothetical protein
MADALCYKPEDRRFESRWGNWISSIYLTLPAAYAQDFTQPLTEMRTWSRKVIFLGSRALPVRKTENLTAVFELISRQYGILNISQPYRPPQPVTGVALASFPPSGFLLFFFSFTLSVTFSFLLQFSFHLFLLFLLIYLIFSSSFFSPAFSFLLSLQLPDRYSFAFTVWNFWMSPFPPFRLVFSIHL